MNAVVSPIVSEFETQEEEASYIAWRNAKVAQSPKDTRPNIPHDVVMAKMRAYLQSKDVHAAS